MSFAIRAMQDPDLDAVAALTTQVEHDSAPEVMTQRLRWLGARAAHSNAFFVAWCEASCTIVGFGHAHGVQLLGSIAYAEIAGLVVDLAHRRRGVGRSLVAACERWAVEQAFPIMRLRPGRQRPHASPCFYRQLGYVPMPPATVLHKTIGTA